MQARITNKNTHPYQEKFDGKLIRIEPGQSIEMEYYEGVKFMGTVCPVTVDAGGTPKPESYKKLVLERIGSEHGQRIICNYDGTEHASEEDLRNHIIRNGFAKLAQEPPKVQPVVDPKLAQENAELKLRLKLLEDKLMGLADKAEEKPKSKDKKE